MPVSKRLRFEVLRRDGHHCRYCGKGVADAIITVDHVVPTALGGTDLPDNLVAACEDCNNGKTSTIPDGPTIAGAADDAVRWARAIKLAAAELEAQEEPKHEYRAAFKAAWEHWGYDSGGKRKTFELDPEWATTMDRFRLAGLPATVWPDIVESTMTSRTKLDNRFRYCCGIGWRMVSEMQERAKEIVATSAQSEDDEEDEDRDVIAEAALEVWVNEWPGHISNEQGKEFEASVKRLREEDTEYAHRILQGAQFAAWFHTTTIDEAIAHLDRDAVHTNWSISWYNACREFPNDAQSSLVYNQAVALLDSGVALSRILFAAVHAGSHRSTCLHFSLSDKELALTGQSRFLARATEIWAVAFSASADRRPSPEEHAAFEDSVHRIARDGGYLVRDLNAAATMAGAYQGTDLSTCLTRYDSVFEAAARPLQEAPHS